MVKQVDSILYTKASENVKQQVADDLKLPNPSEESAKAAIVKHKGKQLNETKEKTNNDT